MNLTAVVAPNPHAAAQYYPAGYWLSLMKVPDKSEFPGTGDTGNGISPGMRSQAQWVRSVKSGGCTACHQIGNKAMREIPKVLGNFQSSAAAWDRRIQSGQAGAGMSAGLNNFGRRRVLEMFADWTDRVAAGEVPPAPPRPRGLERNIVITQWDWADPKCVLARLGINRSQESTHQRERIDLRRAGAQLRLRPGPRSCAPHGDQDSAVGARSKDAADQPRDAAALAILGRRGDLDKQEQRAQSDARRKGAPLADVRCKAVRESGCLQGWIDASIGESVSGQYREPASADVRPADEKVHAHRHVLLDASPDVCRGRQPYAVDEWRRSGAGLVEHQDVRSDRR